MANLYHKRSSVGLGILVLSSGVLGGATWNMKSTGLPSAVLGIAAVTINTATPSILYARSSNGSIFKSTDGAGSWKPINGIGGVNAVVIDLENSSTVYAATSHGIFKSNDGGESWNNASTGLTNGSIRTLVIDPSSTLYAASTSNVFKSQDGGGSWVALPAFNPANLAVGSLAIDAISSTLYAVLSDGSIYRSTDGGENWNAIKAGAPNTVFADSALPLVIDPTTPSTMYAGSFAAAKLGTGSISKSTDGGQTWNEVRAGIPGAAFVRSLVIDPTAPSTLYAGYSGSGGWGVLKSTDAGQSWGVSNTGLPSANSLGSPVAIDPGTPSTTYAGYFDSLTLVGGVSKSTDGGQNWKDASAGLGYFDIRVLVTDSASPANVYSSEGGQLFKSVDAGTNWAKLGTFQISAPSFPPGIPPPPFGAGSAVIRSMLIDFSNPSILYVDTARAGGCAFSDNLLFKSIDSGGTWGDSASPPKSGCVLSGLMAMDPTDSNTLYIGETDDIDGGYWLVKSTDGGANWSTIWSWSQGLVSGINALAIDPSHPSILYAGIGDVSFIDGSDGSGLFKSTDGGATWNNVGLTNSAVTVLAIDPISPSILYAATEGIYSEPRGFRGLFKSTDSGTSWFTINKGLEALIDGRLTITALAIAPENSNVLYAGTSGNGVYKSVDSGANWFTFNDGLSNLNVRAFAVAPHVLYAGTAGGVFSIVDDTSLP
jgi:photosystem II stability/assembly factor-like uncharacterized protein